MNIAFSIESMYLPTGGDLGTIAKLDPLDKIFSCALVRGVLKMFLISYVVVVVVVIVVDSTFTSCLCCFFFLFLSLFLIWCLYMYDHGCHLAWLSGHLLSSYSFGTIYQI